MGGDYSQLTRKIQKKKKKEKVKETLLLRNNYAK